LQCRFKTYFPHIDNVYSHRSTQRHKRKRFVSHYWDCRLKGRPPGTKKSTDPDKKKRKRVARERDLCDVKIKITEYFDQQEYEEQVGQPPPGAEEDQNASALNQRSTPGPSLAQNRQFYGQMQMLQQRPLGWDIPTSITQAGIVMPQFTAAPPPPRRPPKKYYTLQRVNGNGGNGKGDGVAGPHKHTLEESDRVKKNSVLRWMAKCEKDGRRKSQVSGFYLISRVFFVCFILAVLSDMVSVLYNETQISGKASKTLENPRIITRARRSRLHDKHEQRGHNHYEAYSDSIRLAVQLQTCL
jgi:glutathione S-transferase